MKKLLLFFSLLLSLLPLQAAAETFEKVTDFSTLKNGDKIILVGNYFQSGSSNPHYNGFMTSDFTCIVEEAEAAYSDTQTFDLSISKPAALITLEASDNTDYPWVMKIGTDYITSSATSTKNGIKKGSSKTAASQIKFQQGTTNHEFNNTSATSRKYLRINILNGKTGQSSVTSGGSALGTKPDIYRLKEEVPTEPADYVLGIATELSLEENEEYPISNLNIPTDAPTLKWTSSNENIVSEIDGVILAGDHGTAILTASWDATKIYNAGHHDITVTVTKPLEKVTAEFSQTSINKAIDPANPETAAVDFTAFNSLGDNLGLDNFNFASDNEAVASYDAATGTLTLKGVGSATITASLTEAAAKLYKLSADSKTTISVSISDINGPIGYELVTSLDQITDEDFYTIASTTGGKTFAMSATTATNAKISSVEATISDGMIADADNILKLQFALSDNTATTKKYSITTTNLEKNGALSGTSSGTDLKIGDYSTVGSTSLGNDGFAKINFAGTRQILFATSNSVFGHYASSNATANGYAQVSIYKLNFVKADAPIVGDFDGKTVGDEVTFTVRHSSHRLQYREWTRAKAVSRAEAEISYGEWNDVEGTTHTHVIKDLSEVGENVAEHGVQVRAIDTRGNISLAVGFSYNGDQTVTGIEGVAAEAEGEGELYNLQGARVDRRAAAPGLYIERRGGKAVKVVL